MADLIAVCTVLLSGLGMTLKLLAYALAVGFVFGLPIGVLHVFGAWPIRLALRGFDLVMRGFPAIVLLFLCYFGLGGIGGIHLTSLQAAVLALGLRSAAYQGELVRGAIEMVDQGQLLAARSVGLSTFGALRSIILPQALRFCLPGLANEYSIVLKDTSLAFTVGVVEMMSRAKFLAISSHQMTLVYLSVAGVYWALTQVGLASFFAAERGTRIPGLGSTQRSPRC
ncbi:amino acid ABC transporter permease [Candidatus Bipolaricaulota bacterium]|nr:amino acid ABC transporter permease [Candidatus Bipolaricaulota bacterium]